MIFIQSHILSRVSCMAKRKSTTRSDSESTPKFKPAGVVIEGNEYSLQKRQIYLHDCNITSISSEIGKLRALKYLSFTKNDLTSLPVEIGDLISLTHLELGYNNILSLPAEIGKLIALELLSLKNNQLTSLPAEIGNLSKLDYLRLDGNNLTSLPVEIGDLSAMKILVLDFNQLTSIPIEIGGLSTMEQLGLGHNQLTSIPIEIGNLSALKELDVSYNQLASVPPEIRKITGLEFISLKGNGKLFPLALRESAKSILLTYRFDVEETQKWVVYLLKHFLWKNGWSEQNHHLYPKGAKEAIFTTMMIASVQNGIPRHSEAQFYKLPKEIIYTIFHFICKDYEVD